MELAKKLIIIPEDRMQAVMYLSDLDKKMDLILKKKGLNDSEKAALYLQVLQKYVSYQFPTPPQQENPKTPPPDTLESEVVNAAPIRYKSIAKDIYQHVKKHLIRQGEVVLENQVYPETHVITLINNFLRNTRKSTIGQQAFYHVLKETGLPVQYDVNHKLSNILYAHKPKWLKL